MEHSELFNKQISVKYVKIISLSRLLISGNYILYNLKFCGTQHRGLELLDISFVR